ncbi:hypothetical protein B0187_02870 [Haemophilus paracuniculus]|uniref:Uncharacterized protein n=1 Tax=Haemophilus paracuniculus TaxID=734 RepID=A0A1T0AUA2_9PAST|nr:hypothetical protein B0187_02870 [Haemophilus paracuniculus]
MLYLYNPIYRFYFQQCYRLHLFERRFDLSLELFVERIFALNSLAISTLKIIATPAAFGGELKGLPQHGNPFN